LSDRASIAGIPSAAKHLIKNESPFGATNTVFSDPGQARVEGEGEVEEELLLVVDEVDTVVDVTVEVEVVSELLVVDVVIIEDDGVIVEEDGELLEDGEEAVIVMVEVVDGEVSEVVQVASIITVIEPYPKLIDLGKS
jgi:hypothetical protein